MANMSAQELRMAVVSAARSDPEFRNELVKDLDKAVIKRFGPQSLRVRVHFEDENEYAVLIPQKTPHLTRSIDRLINELGARTPTRDEFEVIVIQRAWNEPAFLEQLRKDPRAAINSVLQQYKASFPAQATVRLYEEQPGEALIVMSGASVELSEEELEGVAGGVAPIVVAVVASTAGAVAGSVASKVIDKIWKVE
jgi:hypothetical protein